MKLIGDNAGRRPIAFQSPSQGVNAEQNVNTQTPIVLDNQGGVVLAGSTSFNDGNGIFLGWCNGIPVFSLGSDSGGMSWDGSTLNVAGAISALSGFISGDLNIGTGGDIRSGMTAYMTGTGFWIDYNGGSPRFCIGNPAGDYLAFNGTALNGVVTTGILQALTSNLIDDASLGTTADLTQTTSLPPNVAGAIALGMMTDVQVALPLSMAIRQALFADNGGAPYYADLYDTNFNIAGNAATVVTTTSATAFATISGIIAIHNPGQPVTIYAEADCLVRDNTATVTSPGILIQYSLDGGVTWTNGPEAISTFTALNGSNMMLHATLFLFNVTPTADIQFRLSGGQTVATSITFTSYNLVAKLLPVANFYLIAPLVATVPATAAMSCRSTSPATTCTATGNVKCSVTGGVNPITPSWAKVSGTGTLSGTTTLTCTITDTETTTTGGATHTTTVNCMLTDSQSYTGATASQSANVATIVIGAHNIPVGAVVTATGFSVGAYNGTFTITGITATSIKYTVAGLPAAATGGTVGTVNVTTNNCVMTGTFTLQYAAVTNSITSIGAPTCLGATGSSCNASTTLTNNPAGGDGSYTYANTRTAGTFTLSGSTTKSFTCSDSGVIPGSDTGTAKGTVTDGHSNTGNASKSLTFTWNSNS